MDDAMAVRKTEEFAGKNQKTLYGSKGSSLWGFKLWGLLAILQLSCQSTKVKR
jgi:hypothetical protein